MCYMTTWREAKSSGDDLQQDLNTSLLQDVRKTTKTTNYSRKFKKLKVKIRISES